MLHTGATELLHDRLWLGGITAFTQVPHLDLFIHCAGEIEPNVPNAASEIIWLKLDDSRPITTKELSLAYAAASRAADEIRAGHKVLISCAHGINRSALVAGLTLKQLGWTGERAIRLMRRRRSKWILPNQEYVSILTKD